MSIRANLLFVLAGITAMLICFHTPAVAQAIGSPTPSPTPFEAPKTAPPEITIGSFYNAKKQTNPTFLLWGTADALAQISINIFPDNVAGSTTVDNVGRWQWTTPKSLTNGTKQLTITITNDKGGQTVKTDTFIVTGAFQFPTAAVLFMLAIGVVVGIYVWMQLKKPQTHISSTPPSTTPVHPEEAIHLPEKQSP
jgi:hypothetical protein